MTPEQLAQLSGLYHAALELAPQQREAFLRESCRDEELLREVKHLLEANENAGSFLARPVTDKAAGLIAEKTESAMIGRVLGHYRIQSRIGAGGMGEVYLATDETLGRKVALKLLPDEFANDPERLRRFITEAKAASATNHPNIIGIHEIGEADGTHYIAEEFVEGENLRRRIGQGPIPLLEALDIAHQTANALAAAHAVGIVHRDIKPENIMLRPDGFVKLLDFGLAGMNPTEAMAERLSNAPTLPQQTAAGVILGTVNYMSPEQTRGQKLDARSDLWSLGVVLYEMLTGERPFHGESMPDIFVAILERQPAPLTESLAEPPAQLEQILDKLLAKNREQRYQSAAQLAAELKRLHRRLELDAERESSGISESATLFIQSPVSATVTPPVNRPVAPIQPLDLETSTRHIEPASKELAAVARLSRATIVMVVFLFVAVIAIASWALYQQKAPATVPPAATEQLPERSFSYSLTVQKMRDGKVYQSPFQSSGRDIYENGWRFWLNFNSQQSGYLYIINEGPATAAVIKYTLLFPQLSGKNSPVEAETGKALRIGFFQFDKHLGTERFLIVWAARPITELEEIKASVLNDSDQGVITNAYQRDTVRALLASSDTTKVGISEDKVKKQISVTGRGEVLLYMIELEHH